MPDSKSFNNWHQEDVLSMAVRVAGKEEPVMGKLRPKQAMQSNGEVRTHDEGIGLRK
jgi:hypothetical protein